MSSKAVRDSIETFVANNLSSENLVDMTAEFRELQDFLDGYNLGRNDPFLGVQYIGNVEEPQTIPSTNSSGRYREEGVIFFHITAVATNSAGGDILTRAEALRDAFRGQRIGDVVVLSVSPPNFNAGATLQFEGGYTSASVLIDYRFDTVK